MGFGLLFVSGFSSAGLRATSGVIPSGNGTKQGTTLPISSLPPTTVTVSDSPTTVKSSFTVVGQTSWLQNQATVVVSAKQIEDPTQVGLYKITIAPSSINTFSFVPNPDTVNHADESNAPVSFTFTETGSTKPGVANIKVQITLSITPGGGGTPVVRSSNITFPMNFHPTLGLTNPNGPINVPVPMPMPMPMPMPEQGPAEMNPKFPRRLYMENFYDWYVGDRVFGSYYTKD